MSHSLKDLNRRKLNLNVNDVTSLLPEHYQTEYGVDSGSLTKLLEIYYEYLDSDGANAFTSEINEVFTARDISQSNIDYLDELITEIGNGLKSSSFFQQPRLMARLLPLYYKSKGTLVGTEGFFRGFFGEEIQVEFPKDQLLYAGGIDSTGTQGYIGFEYQFRLHDDAVFQIFSVLIKSGLSTNDYLELYKRFVHPAGMNFSGQLQTDAQGIITLTANSVNPRESDEPGLLVLTEATQSLIAPFTQLTGLIDSNVAVPSEFGNLQFRISLNDDISKYSTITVATLNKAYTNIAELLTPNSFTFDDSDVGDSAGSARIDTSFATETMDNDMFTRYLSDSAI